MYIPEFWCGVGATLISLFAAFFVYEIYINRMEGEDDDGKTGKEAD